ncbi:MAG TPA: hypothetical protein VIN93_06025 [Bryobacteraceae bacterium]|jgi:hypothetical protein
MPDNQSTARARAHVSHVWLSVLLLVLVNLLIVAKLFGVEYSSYTGSIEGTFIAIPRIMAKYPGQWQWWPFWNGGLPFECAYLPFTHWLVAGFSLLTRLSAARSFHIVTAAIYLGSAPAVFWMALELSRRLGASLIAALTYSSVSASALLVPAIAVDAGGALNLRRLQALVFYGESPHTVALALLPVAVVCFSRALTTRQVKWQLLAGGASACVVLSNAFGIVMLALALLCWLMAFPQRPWWKAPLTVAAIGFLTWCWISPWLSPSMIRAIHANAATTGGDYRYTERTWIALALVAAGFLLLWLVLRLGKAPSHLRFFLLLGYVPTAIVMTGYFGNAAIIPQPTRYQLDMDLVLPLAIVFAGASILDRIRARARFAVSAVVVAALAFQTVHSALFAQELIRSAEPGGLSWYQIASWLDTHRQGERAFISGSASFWYNDFTDNPQLLGGHDQHTVNTFLPIVRFTIYSGMNAGDRDAEYSIFWLKAFGTHLISVPGSDDPYKSALVHPRKFDGVLPLLWRSQAGSIYEVPARSSSLAHVIPAAAVVTRTPVHGLDIAPVEAYVAALEDPAFPPAAFRWKNLSEAEIDATVSPGQVIGVEVTYERGWEAWANGKPQRVFGDAIGQMVIEPDCLGPCRISLRYTGGWEHRATRAMSLAAMLLAMVLGWRRRRKPE